MPGPSVYLYTIPVSILSRLPGWLSFSSSVRATNLTKTIGEETQGLSFFITHKQGLKCYLQLEKKKAVRYTLYASSLNGVHMLPLLDLWVDWGCLLKQWTGWVELQCRMVEKGNQVIQKTQFLPTWWQDSRPTKKDKFVISAAESIIHCANLHCLNFTQIMQLITHMLKSHSILGMIFESRPHAPGHEAHQRLGLSLVTWHPWM